MEPWTHRQLVLVEDLADNYRYEASRSHTGMTINLRLAYAFAEVRIAIHKHIDIQDPDRSAHV